MMTAAVTLANMHMDHINVTTAFLFAVLEEEVEEEVEIPEEVFHVDMAGKILRLLKAVPGNVECGYTSTRPL